MNPPAVLDEVRAAAIGAGSGLAGTTAMSAVMLAAQRAGFVGELPPHRIADAAVDRTPLRDDADAGDRRDLGWLLHFGFGAAAGAIYAMLIRHVRPPGPAISHGVAFACLVWFVSYMGWVPALGILPPATEDRPDRPSVMIAAHVVFGAILGGLVGGLDPERVHRR